MKKNVNIAFSSGLNENSKVIMNRNIIDRAKTIMPDLVYDEKPYLVITDEDKEKIYNLIETLEDLDDVQDVYHNMEE